MRIFRPDFPFQPTDRSYFYGWAIVAVGTIGIVASIPGQTAGVGPFTPALEETTPLPRLTLAVCYGIGTILSGLMLPLGGKLYDWLGARALSVVTAIAFGLSLIFIGASYEIARYFAKSSAGIFLGKRYAESTTRELVLLPYEAFVFCVTLTIGFFLIRFWGQGMLTLTCRSMIGKWFNKRREIASSISGGVAAAAFASSPVVLFLYVDKYGWSTMWTGTGVLMLFMALFFYVYFRDNPESCGTIMDGRIIEDSDAHMREDRKIHHDFRGLEALRTYAFWAFALSVCLIGMIGTAIPFHAAALAEEVGITGEGFYAMFVWTPLASVPSTFLIGWLAGKFRLKYSLIIMTTAYFISNLGVFLLPSTVGAFFFIAGAGVAWGAFGNLITLVWPRYFGRRYVGEVSGWAMFLLVIASALGPAFFSIVQWQTGSYMPAVITSLVACTIMLIAAFWADNPQRHRAPEAA